MSGPDRPAERTHRGTTTATRVIGRLLTALAVVFAGMIGTGTAVVEPLALLPVVALAALGVGGGAAVALRSALREGPARGRAAALAVAALAAAAPIPLLSHRWFPVLELVAAVALVALGRRSGAVVCVALTALLWACAVLKVGAQPPPYYVAGVPLLAGFIGVPLALVRGLRRRDRARAGLLALVERRTRSARALAIVDSLSSVAGAAPALSAAGLASRLREVHASVRSSAVQGAPVDVPGVMPERAATRRRLLLLVVAAGVPGALPVYFVAVGLDAPGVSVPLPVAAAVALILTGLWFLAVRPVGARPERSVALAGLAVVSIGSVVVLGEEWAAVLTVFVAAVIAVGPRRLRNAVVVLAAAAFVLIDPIIDLATGGSPLDAVGDAAYGLPFVVLAAVLALVPAFVAASEQADALERVLLRARSQGAARALAADSHDLLGQTLAAAALQADLADRTGAAAREAHRTTALALLDRATAEARDLADAVPRLDLGDELETAAACLRANGVRVTLTAVAEEARDDALAWTVREATANILRHSAASTVSIDLAREGDALVLTLENDRPDPAEGGPGVGLTRIGERLGGAVEVEQDAVRFRLRVRQRIAVPAPDPMAAP